MNVGLNIFKHIHSYFTGRTITVKVGNALSDPFTPLSRVPQGSVLAPLLYHDLPLPSHTSLKYFIYALFSVAKNSELELKIY